MTDRSFEFRTQGGTQVAEVAEGGRENSPVIVVAPALGVRASYYTKLCRGLAARGVDAVAIDQPGLGASPLRPARGRDWGYAELIEHYSAAVSALTRLRPNAPIVLLGHSIGGQVGLMLAGRPEVPIRGVMLVASGTPHFRAWEGSEAVQIRLATMGFALVARTLGYFPGDKLGFGGRNARRLICEWARVSKTGAYEFEGLSGEALLRAPGPPVLAIHLRGDRLAPEAAMREVLERLEARHVDFETWAEPPHRGDHNRWPSEPAFIVDRAMRFVESLEDV